MHMLIKMPQYQHTRHTKNAESFQFSSLHTPVIPTPCMLSSSSVQYLHSCSTSGYRTGLLQIDSPTVRLVFKQKKEHHKNNTHFRSVCSIGSLKLSHCNICALMCLLVIHFIHVSRHQLTHTHTHSHTLTPPPPGCAHRQLMLRKKPNGRGKSEIELVSKNRENDEICRTLIVGQGRTNCAGRSQLTEPTPQE